MADFWKAALLRAGRTFCQTFAASIGTAALLSEVNWLAALSASALAALLSVMTSLATGLPEANGGKLP
ncbi:MAG: holin [Christensenellales bacterium]